MVCPLDRSNINGSHYTIHLDRLPLWEMEKRLKKKIKMVKGAVILYEDVNDILLDVKGV